MDKYFKEQPDNLEMENIQLDPEEVTYHVNKILKKKNTPYQMANEAYADQLYPYLQEEIPGLTMVKVGIEQWLLATPRAQKKALEMLENRKEKQIAEINETKAAMEKLEKLSQNLFIPVQEFDMYGKSIKKFDTSGIRKNV